MGDFGTTSLFSSTLSGPKSSIGSSSSAAISLSTSTMQDDLLIEKQSTGKPAPLSPSAALDNVGGPQEKSKDAVEVESISITSTTPSSTEKEIIACSTTSALQGFTDPARVPILWADDTTGLDLPVNGSIAAFQNFPTGGSAGFFAAPQQWGGGPQTAAAVASQGLSPWSRGRSVPNLPPLHSSLHAAATAAAVAGLQGRKPSPTFPGHPGPAAHPSCISPVRQFRRSTSYPGKGNIYPPQPAPTFEVTAAEERDLLLPPFQQVNLHRNSLCHQFQREIFNRLAIYCLKLYTLEIWYEEITKRRSSKIIYAQTSGGRDRMTANGNSPLDSMRTLEHYLNDIMRAGAADTPEHLKGEP
ncbi:hypothetical protein M0802_003791 [Mischocyttarus mexicanus]|nr:hypothetical protein M0802_003791 [Mischocyttarus mexicanus]